MTTFLKLLLAARGESAYHAASACGVCPSTFSVIANGVRRASAQQAKRIGDHFNVPPELLLVPIHEEQVRGLLI